MLALIIVLLAPAPDWASGTYDLSPHGPKTVKLTQGLWESGSPVKERVSLRKTVNGDLNGDGTPETVLLFEYWGGGQERQDLVHVYVKDEKAKRPARVAVLDGGYAKNGTLDSIAIRDGRLEVGHDAEAAGMPVVVVKSYGLLTRGLFQPKVVDLRSMEAVKPLDDLKAQRVLARKLLTKTPAAGAAAYLKIHLATHTPASLGDAAFALMKAKDPIAKDALTAAAHQAKTPEQRGAVWYNLARYQLDQKDKEAAIVAVRQSLRHRPGNEPTKKLLTLLRAGLGVRGIDWENRTYVTDVTGDDEGGEVKLTDGTWRMASEDMEASVDLGGVMYGDLTGNGKEEAVLILHSWGGGTGRFDEIEVYDATGDMIGGIPGGDRADGGIAEARVKGGKVHVDRMSSGPFGGSCCPEFTVNEVWIWKGGKFVEVEEETTLGEFGQGELTDESDVLVTVKAVEESMRAGNVDAAFRALTSVIGTIKHRERVYPLFGYILSQSDGYAAIPVLKAALRYVKTDNEKAQIYYNLGRAHAAGMPYSGKKEAIAAYEMSLKLRPGNAATLKALAEAKASPDKK